MLYGNKTYPDREFFELGLFGGGGASKSLFGGSSTQQPPAAGLVKETY